MEARGVVGVGFLLVAILLAGGCGGDGDEVARGEVSACDDLRRRENELIAVVNQSLAELAGTEDDRARARAIVEGFDRLISLARDQLDTVGADEPGLTEALAAGAEEAVAALEAERRRFTDEVEVVTQADEHGRAGQLQNAVEKAFSLLEPPRHRYVEAGLAEAIDADPDCRFVTQRGDPAR